MAKESYYFSHDYNARNDRKIAALVCEYRSSGYGIFWGTCEMMHEEGGTLEFDDITFYAIAKDLNEDFELVKNVIDKCISKYKLFFVENEKVLSERVKRNLFKRHNISEVRSKAGKEGAIAKQTSAIAKQNQAKKGKKGNEIKKENGVVFACGAADRGVSIDKEKSLVFFEDGSFQNLGLSQQQMVKEGSYEPHYIKKGKIE